MYKIYKKILSSQENVKSSTDYAAFLSISFNILFISISTLKFPFGTSFISNLSLFIGLTILAEIAKEIKARIIMKMKLINKKN
jgi:hypothetical protein